MKQVVGIVALFLLGLAGCSEENLQPQASAQSAPATTDTPQQPLVPKHNLSRVGETTSITPEMLATIVVGKTTTSDLAGLLGEIKPFTLGDGKQIYRYDVGKFIFGADGVLLRQHLNH